MLIVFYSFFAQFLRYLKICFEIGSMKKHTNSAISTKTTLVPPEKGFRKPPVNHFNGSPNTDEFDHLLLSRFTWFSNPFILALTAFENPFLRGTQRISKYFEPIGIKL
jgi:hypothetical protein